MNAQNETKTTNLLRVAALVFAATATILYAQPVITRQPADQTASLFADATFKLGATGNAPLTYQWRFSGTNLVNRTNAFLTLTNVQRASAGGYDAVVTNASGSITSRVATLTISPFNSLYAFGFSWTDTHNCDWPAPQFYNHHACNGPMWPEFLSTNLGLAYVETNNYAACGSTSVDIMDQIYNFPVPSKPQLSLYCMWADGPDTGTWDSYQNWLTNDVAGSNLFQTTLLNNSNSVNRLYAKGARTILIELDAEWGNCPCSAAGWGTDAALLSKYSDYLARFRVAFVEMMATYSQRRSDLRIIYVDTWPLWNNVLSNPSQYGFTVADINAIDDPALTDKSFNGPGANYVYWGAWHPSSKFHKLFAGAHLEAITNSVLETLEATMPNSTPIIRMNHLQIGRDYTLEASADLKTWSNIQSFTADAGTNQWSTPPGDGSAVFFRLTWQR